MYGNSRHDQMRQAMIQSLMQPKEADNRSLNVGALFSPLAGALMQKKMDAQNQARDARGNEVLARALGAMQGRPAEYDKRTDIQWDAQKPDRQKGLGMLLQAPETRELGQGLAMAELQKQFGGGADAPSSVREWEYYNSMSPEQQAAYREMKRATVDKGMILQDGRVVPMQGYNQAKASQEYAGEAGTQQAKLDFEPMRKGEVRQAESDVDLQMKPQIAEATAERTEAGKQRGEAVAKLESMESQFPRLNEVVGKLSELGQKATYTMAGRGRDIAMRELGMDPTEGAVARTEYMATVDNEVLPLLRQTFGAQFTVQEGESLRRTLGDPNKSPQEKDAVLRAFIQQKAGEMQSLRRQTGKEENDGWSIQVVE